MMVFLINITVNSNQILSAAVHRSEANRLHSAIRSMKAENREKWTQVKKAFAISKEVNQKAMDLLRQKDAEKEEALKGVIVELDEYKEAATSALMIIRMAQRVNSPPGDSTPSDSTDDIATTLTSAAMALLEQLGELQMRYAKEFEEAWNLRTSSSSSVLEPAMPERDLGEYLLKLPPLLLHSSSTPPLLVILHIAQS